MRHLQVKSFAATPKINDILAALKAQVPKPTENMNNKLTLLSVLAFNFKMIGIGIANIQRSANKLTMFVKYVNFTLSTQVYVPSGAAPHQALIGRHPNPKTTSITITHATMKVAVHITINRNLCVAKIR